VESDAGDAAVSMRASWLLQSCRSDAGRSSQGVAFEPDAPAHRSDDREAEADERRRPDDQRDRSDPDAECTDNPSDRPDSSHVLTVRLDRITEREDLRKKTVTVTVFLWLFEVSESIEPKSPARAIRGNQPDAGCVRGAYSVEA
jgi:hypothetical protein